MMLPLFFSFFVYAQQPQIEIKKTTTSIGEYQKQVLPELQKKMCEASYWVRRCYGASLKKCEKWIENSLSDCLSQFNVQYTVDLNDQLQSIQLGNEIATCLQISVHQGVQKQHIKPKGKICQQFYKNVTGFFSKHRLHNRNEVIQQLTTQQTPKLCAASFINRSCYNLSEIECQSLVPQIAEKCVQNFMIPQSMSTRYLDRLKGMVETCMGMQLVYKLKKDYQETNSPACENAKKKLEEQAKPI